MRLAAGTVLTIAAVTSGCSTSTDHSAHQVPSSTLAAQPTIATTSAPKRGTESWGGTGVFSVGTTPSRGLKASIPPGRYRIELDDPKLGVAAVTRCSDVPCSSTTNFLGGDSGYGASFVSVIDILGSDAAVRLDNAKLTPVGE